MGKPLPEPTPAQVCREIGHDWITVYDEDGEPVGKFCQRCNAQEGRQY